MERFIQTMLTNMMDSNYGFSFKKSTAMRKMLNMGLLVLVGFSFFGCGGGSRGQLTGVQGREEWYMDDPFGMLYIPMGSYNMGPSDQDVPYAKLT